ncbi:MAG: zinc-dependent metalloprotease, partial [Actinomycetota bacterium]
MSGLVDEKVATRVAARLSARSPLDGSYLLENLDESIAALVAEAEPLIGAETGWPLPGNARALVMSRAEWAAANVAPMLELMAPLLDKAQEKMKSGPVSPFASIATGPMLGAQMGVVLAFLSQRVLGQYDLSGHADDIWFVGPNMVLTERRFGFVPRDFRLWVAVHELTHRAQFVGKPWVREYFHSNVRSLLEVMDFDGGKALKRLAEGMMSGNRSEGGIVTTLLEPEQLERFNRLQAFMSVIEGHANFVMDRVAAE